MKILRSFLLTLLMSLISVSYSSAKSDLNLIPLPQSIEYKRGYFITGTDVKLLAANNDARLTAELLNTWLKQTLGYTLPIVDQCTRDEKFIAISVLPSDSSEQYRLIVGKTSVLLEGGAAGLVRGSSTLLQLLFHAEMQKTKKGSRIPCMIIHDQPEFSYRGVHLDVCRHFFPVAFVKRYIDQLAMHKMNTFHWHLTDDQGWRIEIKKYPKLTSVGGWRNGSMVGPYRNQQFDTLRYGGFYTQEEIRDVVAYAAERQITVVPEIEMPGHAQAALAAYPEYSCTGKVAEVAKSWGVFEDVFCVKDSTFNFLEDILTEVIALFPSTYIHIGGDECPKERWKVCPRCIETKYANNIRDEHELQSYFIQRIEKFLNSKGRKIIGWDEILEGGLAPNATVMSWRGIDGGIAAARSGHQAIMTPGTHCYFDHYQGERAMEPLAFGGYTPLEKVYAFRPIPDSLTAEEAKFIIGAQANLWTEYMYDDRQVQYMLHPRLCALSEVLWSDSTSRDLTGFYKRIQSHQAFLDRFNWNYSTSWMQPALQIEGGMEVPSLKLSLKAKVPATISTAFTNGSELPIFEAYRKPLTISTSGTLFVRSVAGGKEKEVKYPFEFSKSTGAKVELVVPGSRSYANPGSTLTDGITGVYPWTGKHWVGWYGKDAVVQLDLGSERQVDSVVVVYLHDPVSWIHAPKQIVCSNSGNGAKSTSVPTDKAINRTVIYVGEKMKNLGLLIQSIGKNPEGSAGAGDDGWMFVSEILVY